MRLNQSTADDYVIDLLAQCEQKLMKLMEDLDGKDVSELYSGMEDEEVRVKGAGCYFITFRAQFVCF